MSFAVIIVATISNSNGYPSSTHAVPYTGTLKINGTVTGEISAEANTTDWCCPLAGVNYLYMVSSRFLVIFM